jgi:hypothetical protein
LIRTFLSALFRYRGGEYSGKPAPAAHPVKAGAMACIKSRMPAQQLLNQNIPDAMNLFSGHFD